MHAHPLDPLSPEEIKVASATFRTELLRKGIRSVKSTYVDLIEREFARLRLQVPPSS